MIAYLVFLALLGLLRLLELVHAKRNLRRRTDARVQPEPIYKWMVALHAGMFALLPLELWLRQPRIGGWVTWLALVAVLCALALRFWTLETLGHAWNVRIVDGEDLGIVTSGPYRWVRHPNYVVVMLELVAVPLVTKLYFSAILLSFANAWVLRRRIAAEEEMLMRHPKWAREMAPKPRFLPHLQLFSKKNAP